MYTKLSILAVLCSCVILASGACNNPDIKTISFTTQDARIVSQIAYIGEFTIKCANSGSEKLPLFAEIDDKISPVVRVGDNKFQISWTEEIKKARTGDRQINLFDEDGYYAVRKAQRSNEDFSSIKPLAKVYISHPGAFNGPIINSEILISALIAFVAYVAFSTKSKLLA